MTCIREETEEEQSVTRLSDVLISRNI